MARDEFKSSRKVGHEYTLQGRGRRVPLGRRASCRRSALTPPMSLMVMVRSRRSEEGRADVGRLY